MVFYITSWLIPEFTFTNIVLDIFSAFNSCSQNCCAVRFAIFTIFFSTWYRNANNFEKRKKPIFLWWILNIINNLSLLLMHEFTSISSFGYNYNDSLLMKCSMDWSNIVFVFVCSVLMSNDIIIEWKYKTSTYVSANVESAPDFEKNLSRFERPKHWFSSNPNLFLPQHDLMNITHSRTQ